MFFLILYSVSFCFLWSAIFLLMMWTLKQVPLFHEEMKILPEQLSFWPCISIIIPACNEAKHIEAAVRSILRQDYPKLEVLVMNDRSTDETGNILERLAEKDSRLKVFHINTLPSGWLGKVHAMHRGVQEARGKWFLFTDADIHFGPGMLKRT